ncbi:uncharacterized protein FOMMEDRAFT_161514 [Fomitiporia mediterranea MF3/22]|uniref:uncharacterized protein n=1 Tax=Fomitiporia mediterranea (strain MF3/22) TaxID=694068 RepID=UPI00044090AB|nr:uncharacterized protein FOMMEDRAFT_161514 [Fomitiporia mediterranea MF3/22]EJC98683.1 hypothetical protein FOMMEDRAFT_161514 [Fomitiporia mediterranea MF3/22]
MDADEYRRKVEVALERFELKGKEFDYDEHDVDSKKRKLALSCHPDMDESAKNKGVDMSGRFNELNAQATLLKDYMKERALFRMRTASAPSTPYRGTWSGLPPGARVITVSPTDGSSGGSKEPTLGNPLSDSHVPVPVPVYKEKRGPLGIIVRTKQYVSADSGGLYESAHLATAPRANLRGERTKADRDTASRSYDKENTEREKKKKKPVVVRDRRTGEHRVVTR